MRYMLFCYLVLSMVGCDSTTLVDELSDDPVEDISTGDPPRTPTFADEAMQLTNAARTASRQCGSRGFDAVSALTWNERLEEAAVAHSKDMASRNYFNHRSPEGGNPGDRIQAAGYVARTWGENIAAGQPGLEAVIQGWLGSPGHCANIMNGAFTEFAVGMAEDRESAYRIYWTMVLAAPR